MLPQLNLNFLFLLFFLLPLTACSQQENDIKILGHTMGTTYSVLLTELPDDHSKSALKEEIEQRLQNINSLMSTYDKNSQLTEFNQSRETGWHAVDKELAEIVILSLQISEQSSGAFDITVGPLVNMWGFGPSETEFTLPNETEINIAMRSIGYKNLQARLDPPALNKNIVDLYVDLSAIAKGYAVDQIANILDSYSIQHYMVEIGGEVKGKGMAPHGDYWRIGVETPEFKRGSIEEIISLNNIAVATSGDYRNYLEHDGIHYSHTIDPRTGTPVEHTLGSVTVLDNSAAIADAWATAFMVLGPEQTFTLSSQLNMPVLLITREGDQYESTFNSAIKPFLSR